MARIGVAHKLSRHLKVSDEVADKLVEAGFRVPKQIKGATKKKLREDAGLTQGEANAVKARWS